MKKKNVIISVLIVILLVLWFSGIAPKKIAQTSGTNYVDAHFPEMELVCVKVEYSEAFGDYLIEFKDKDKNLYSCVIGPKAFPCSLGQGLFAIESYYADNYGNQ